MPQLLVRTDLTPRRMDAVLAAFRARLRVGALDPPRAPTTAQLRCVAAFIGANQTTVRVGGSLIAQAIRPIARQAIAAGQRPRGPSIAEASFPGAAARPQSSRSPARALVSVIRRTDDRQEHR